MVWHHLSTKECDYTEKILEEMKAAAWVNPLTSTISSQGGPRKIENRPLMFEARVCYELFRSGVMPQYEYAAGIGDYTIDLYFTSGNSKWLFEIVSVDESAALEKATYEEELTDSLGNGIGSKAKFLELRGDAKDQRLSEAGEMIQLQQKLYEKVCKKGKPHKFPEIAEQVFHGILIDARGFGGGDGPDMEHIRQIMYGPDSVHEQQFVQYYEGKEVAGIFDRTNARRAAELMRERIHVIGFCNEKDFKPGVLQQCCTWAPNQFLPNFESIVSKIPSCLRRQSAN